MSTKLIDYTLDTVTPTNPGGLRPATVTGCTVGTGPGSTTLGTYPSALIFGAGGKLTTTLPATTINTVKFCVRTVFKVDSVTSRQTLLVSTALPIAFHLQPSTSGSDFDLVGSVTTAAYGTGQASTRYLLSLHVGQWYAVDLVYDTDTVAVFVDGLIYSLHAFPDGTLASGSGGGFYAGIGSDGVSDPFSGQMAALQFHDDIPIDLEAQLDERRAHPQWHLTYKQEEVKQRLAFGDAVGEFYYDLPSTSWVQRFSGASIVYHDSNGYAFELHGAIHQTYWTLPNRSAIGYPVSDEIAAAVGGSRKSLFSRGGIYWSAATGAVPVMDQIWVDYEGMGESAALGLPVEPVTPISGGWRQLFQRAQMYWRSSSPKAFEVHGAILAKYVSTGGPAVWGYPVSNEEDILSGSSSIGRMSEFENCAIYWSASSGAYEVHGDIRMTYRNAKGPSGSFGFPTSDESDIPGAAGRYNTFQHGSIVWFGSLSETYRCLAFDITLGRVDTQESEGWLRGQNDVYMHATLEDNGHVIHSERLPASGDSDGNNIVDVNQTFNVGPAAIVPNSPSRIIRFGLDIWDSDWPDDDDHLGTFSYTLSMANAWGLKGNPSGLFNSGGFDQINSITWSVAPRVNEALLTEAQKWWGVGNRKTDELSFQQYASAFSDVDSDPEWWDPADWLEKLFYEAVVKGLADNGNCFGMSLEAIYSKKHRSILRLPIDRFTDWEPVRTEFNIKHQYQVGAPALWWFVGEFLSGNTHDPVDVFRQTRDAYRAGLDPVLCISQNWDFSGAPHCILPIAWDDSSDPWKILVHDPNFQSLPTGDPGPRVVEVSPGSNTYRYNGKNLYSGGAWSGGRLHYMPYSVLNDRPRTPVFEAIMLLMTGVIIILGSDGETVSLTDENGVDLDAFGSDSISRLQAGTPLTNKFVSVKGFDQTRECAKERPKGPRPEGPHVPRRPRGHGVLTSEVYMRSERRQFSRTAPPNKRGGSDWTRVTLKEYLCQVAPASIREKFARHQEFVSVNQGRLMYRLASSPVIREILGTAPFSSAVTGTTPHPAITRNFVHTTRAVRGGRLDYGVKQGLSQVLLRAETVTGETHVIQVRDLGTHTNAITVKGFRDQVFTLEVHNQIGVGRDHVKMSLERLPLAAGGEMTINVKPGIGGIEVVSSGQKIDTGMTFEYRKGNLQLRSRFQLTAQNGVRIAPSTVITANVLKVSPINAVFGNPLSSTLVHALP